MKTFKMNIHNGLTFQVNIETILETHNLYHYGRSDDNMYAYYVISKVIGYADHIYSNSDDVIHRHMSFETLEGRFLIHRFASQELQLLENYLNQDLDQWWMLYENEFRKINRNYLEVNAKFEDNCLACQVYIFTESRENFEKRW